MATRKLLADICRMVDQANTEQPVEQQFLNDLKRSIEMDDVKGRKKPSQSYKPSGMNCIRSMYYQMTGAEIENTSAGYCMVGICNSGTDTHLRIQNYVEGMKKNGFDCKYIDAEVFATTRDLTDLEVIEHCGMETKFNHKVLKMHFLTDGIIRYKGKYYILEIKTELGAKWRERTGVDPKHYKQATAYSVSFKLDGVIFLYISRDTLDMKAYMYAPTDEEKQDFVGLIDTCEQYVAKKECPPKPAEMNDRTCRYCGYKKICEVMK